MSSDVTEPLPLSLLSDRGQTAAILDFEMMKFETENKDKLLSKLNNTKRLRKYGGFHEQTLRCVFLGDSIVTHSFLT